MDGDTSVLKVTNLTKKFDDFTAVDDISFSIKEGEIVGLLGPNGAGKTTTIYMLLALITPTKGDIYYFNKSLKIHREEILKDINFSSTYTEFPWRLTVFENFDVLGRYYNLEKRKEKILDVIEMFQLGDLKNKRIGSLSAGQKTKIFLAKAFLNNPRVLLLDEPTASLDPDIAEKVRSIILDQNKKNKIAILFTSHNMSEVEEVCDRVIFINHGKIVAQDTPSGLAKKVKHSQVRFTIIDGIKRGSDLCQKMGWKSQIQDRLLNVSIDEKNIPQLLSAFVEKGIEYSDININKPSLEDFFLQQTR
ncbi:hypothetical protein A2773_06185 [Candidatus Gottesmanbacteria bacterium RIFCSPHIGHO2_01_FULL_39_10]|uniref:ABC transporter domain-containing protein n=1 Tax=Candidatus Gottesmanbacteria bacterium RIFCSPHIGHO2_01_FULL_39_10 TaxID=1798375 RepID=A0A1F5ZMT5_9BACT|nr:MAG: hypothetical protein A2773_06185 [Candidatus Gottesmanbacteria bacterium RIFCSPHIGHO2_01_FULL_39_10]